MKRTASETIDIDAGLVRRASRGDSDAFSALVSKYQDRVYNACYRMCSHEADALDLTQTTFLKALAAIDRFEAKSSFYTWLFRIAVNVTLSQRRQRRRRPMLSLDQPDGDGQFRELAAGGERGGASHDRDGDGGGPLSAERGELRERLETALAQLDDEFRAAVVFKDIEDMDYATIAEVLDVPVGTVKSRIHRGRSMLRQWLVERDA